MEKEAQGRYQKKCNIKQAPHTYWWWLRNDLGPQITANWIMNIYHILERSVELVRC
jgi:hypothetical protein